MRSGNFGKVLGDLETQIMQIVWETNQPVSVGNIAEVINRKRNIAYTTVMTVMGRLLEKGLLKRTFYGKGYVYRPAYSREVFLTKSAKQIIRNFMSSFGEVAIAHFSEEIKNIKPSKRRQLIRFIKLK